MQSVLRLLYPAQCLTCDALVELDHGLCGECWHGAHFITGLVCDCCGVPLPGEESEEVLCDDCMVIARPWTRGRAAFLYSETGRKLVLALKHGDRTDLAPPAARWLAAAARDLLMPETLLVPVPLHWRRRVQRRYNQSAELARALSKLTGSPFRPDLLERRKLTRSLDGLTREARFEVLSGAIDVPTGKEAEIAGKDVLLIDDVMTSGATLAACAEALNAAGVANVNVTVLARVAKDT
ncbi:MAG: double zinc ribbon domain-containing protein [Pseudomonadota bacterium]